MLYVLGQKRRRLDYNMAFDIYTYMKMFRTSYSRLYHRRLSCRYTPCNAYTAISMCTHRNARETYNSLLSGPDITFSKQASSANSDITRSTDIMIVC